MQPERTLDGERMEARRSYQAACISALVLAIGYLAIFPLYARVGAPPSGGEEWFRYLPGKTSIWWAIVGISVFTDMLYLPVARALYLALRAINKNAMLLASVLVGLFVFLDLAVTWSHYASILSLYTRYSAATNEAQRAGYLAAANYGSAMLSSPLEILYAIVTLSVGILVTGVVMLKGTFSKGTAYLGIATGVLGIASLTGSGLAIIGNALAATVWLLFVSYECYRLARE